MRLNPVQDVRLPVVRARLMGEQAASLTPRESDMDEEQGVVHALNGKISERFGRRLHVPLTLSSGNQETTAQTA